MTVIKDYVKSKGVKLPSKINDLDAVKLQLIDEYGFLTRTVKAVTTARVTRIAFNEVIFNPRHFHVIQAREAKGKGLPIIGLVTAHGKNYRLIDGHHRLKWSMSNGETDGFFILLS